MSAEGISKLILAPLILHNAALELGELPFDGDGVEWMEVLAQITYRLVPAVGDSFLGRNRGAEISKRRKLCN